MIKINLLGAEEKSDNSGVLWLCGFGFSVLAALALFYSMYSGIVQDIEELTLERNRLQENLDRLKKTTKEVRELEEKKKELKDKLSVIALLRRNKIGPVRVMDSINAAIPERAWLIEAAERENNMRMTGMALDNQTIAAFMRSLDASDYFDTVDLVETKSSEWQGVEIKQFVLQTKVNYAGKILQEAVSSGDVSSGEVSLGEIPPGGGAPGAAAPQVQPAVPETQGGSVANSPANQS